MRIPVVFATDQNYIFYTCVAITSMAENANDNTSYQVYVLVENKFIGQENLFRKLEERYDNITIRLIFIDPEIFKNVIINSTHVTKATFYRLTLCDLIEETKCIYLDSDVIVTQDLIELYQIELGSNYIAGCRDMWIDMLSDQEREERRERTGIPSLEQYINAGVLLLNLEKIKADGMDQMFQQHLKKDYPHEDQDILNVCCYGRILRLPTKWNLFTIFMGKIEEMRRAGINQDDLEAFRNQQGIIHYATQWIRPWESSLYWANHLWWEIAKLWDEEDVYKRIAEDVFSSERKKTWEYYKGKCEKYNKIVIFGYTKYGRELCDWILGMKAALNVVFCDNDIKKQGSRYGNIPVMSYYECSQHKKEERVLYIVASQRRVEQVCQFLKERGIFEEDMLIYQRKVPEYYAYLDEYYYLDELHEIFEKEKQDRERFQNMSFVDIKDWIKSNDEDLGWIDKFYMDSWLMKE